MRYLSILFVLGLAGHVMAAPVRYATAQEGSVVEVTGDSTLHGWSAQSTEPAMESYVEFNPAVPWDLDVEVGDPVHLAIAFDLPAISLNGSRRGMDRVMHASLRADEYPVISYRLNRARVREVRDDGGVVLTLEGIISCAGSSHTYEGDVLMTRKEEDRLVLTGELEMMMTDFDIEPPRVMFGALRTADEVEVTFTWILERVAAGTP